eukprot:15364352-Ditylum_brightwellii.AAC.1
MPSLPALNDISSEQAKPTENTNKSATWLMDYLSTYPDGKICYYARNMQLQVDSNAAYLVQAGAKSCYTGHFYCASLPTPLSNI